MQRGGRSLHGDAVNQLRSRHATGRSLLAWRPQEFPFLFLSRIVIQRGGRSFNDGRHATGCSLFFSISIVIQRGGRSSNDVAVKQIIKRNFDLMLCRHATGCSPLAWQ
jgi:hypothetical protein